MENNWNEELLTFIENSPSAFHAVEALRNIFLEKGFQELFEHEKWKLRGGEDYFVCRNQSSLIAFRLPVQKPEGFQVIASHSDSPSFKIKEEPEILVEGNYTKLNVERYGGMLCAPWFDRPLSAAGRVVVREGNRVRSCLINLDRDLLLIPNLAIHMNREANEGYRYNAQKDMLPLFGGEKAKDQFRKLVAGALQTDEDRILGMDLFLYNRQKGSIWGAGREFISAPRLDDLQCAFGGAMGLVNSEPGRNAAVFALFDNEEVGSATRQGAASTFLRDILERIAEEYQAASPEDFSVLLENSFLISADNAHAVHPNHPEESDPKCRPYLNQGIVLKFNADQKYTTDGVSAALFRILCEKAGVPCQVFANRSDKKGGSTLGNLSGTRVPVRSVDVGLPQLSMHSPYETAGAMDTEYFIRMAQTFYAASLKMEGPESWALTFDAPESQAASTPAGL
ncbi:MAG: M18 family aminopeptidase [Blautia sp.]|nr:M18 family aminopeptidase [Blautia sp.]